MIRISDGSPLPPAVDAFVESLQSALAPAAPAPLLARIAQSRANGERVLLPTEFPSDAPAARRRLSIRSTGARWMAAAALLVIAGSMYPSLRGRMAPRAPLADTGAPNVNATARSSSTSNPVADLLAPWPRMAYAQSAPGARPAAYAPIGPFDPSRIRLGRRTYVRMSASAYHDMVPHEMFDLRVDTVRLGATRAFRTVTSRIAPHPQGETASAMVDTLWLDAQSLRPLRRHYTAGALIVTQHFTDSSFAEVDSLNRAFIPDSLRTARIPFRRTLHFTFGRHRLFIVNESMLQVVLQALPLSASWRASVSVLDGNNRPFALGPSDFRNLRVTGVDTLQTFSGRFPVWTVQVENGAAGETWRVSQQSGVVLQFEAPYTDEYRQSEVRLIGGLEETVRVAPVKLRR